MGLHAVCGVTHGFVRKIDLQADGHIDVVAVLNDEVLDFLLRVDRFLLGKVSVELSDAHGAEQLNDLVLCAAQIAQGAIIFKILLTYPLSVSTDDAVLMQRYVHGAVEIEKLLADTKNAAETIGSSLTRGGEVVC